jgi:LPXTG-motif cell wall-anchored protein
MNPLRRRIATGLVAAAPLASFALGSAVQATSTTDSDGDADRDSEVRAQVNGSDICYPIVGTGKMSGVPIAVEDANGDLLEDVSDLTFELRDGTGDTQDVTDLIGTAAEQPMVADYRVPADGSTIDSATMYIDVVSNDIGATPPALSFANPGHFFLMCTADPTDPSVKFGDDIEIVALRDGVEVASGMLGGRSAPHFQFSAWWPNSSHAPTLWPLMGVTSTDGTQEESQVGGAEVALELFENTGVRFNPTFALLAIINSQKNSQSDSSVYCRNAFIDSSGSAWTLNATGTGIATALVTGTNLATQAALLRENHPDVDCRDGGPYGNETQYVIHSLAAQLLLIDGPAGRVSDSVAAASDFYLPSVRLVPEDLPDTGADTLAPLFAGLVSLAGGAMMLALPRRRRA